MQAGAVSECRLSSGQCELAELVASGGGWLARVVTPLEAGRRMNTGASAAPADAAQRAEHRVAQASPRQVAFVHSPRGMIGTLGQRTRLLQVLEAQGATPIDESLTRNSA